MASVITIPGGLSILEDELLFEAIRASGPGGQNVNKVSSAIQLRFDARGSASLPDDVAARLIGLAGARATKDGVIVITAERFRDQPRNRADATARLVALIAKAGERKKPRRPTKPTRASVEKRLAGKARDKRTKASRRIPREPD